MPDQELDDLRAMAEPKGHFVARVTTIEVSLTDGGRLETVTWLSVFPNGATADDGEGFFNAEGARQHIDTLPDLPTAN